MRSNVSITGKAVLTTGDVAAHCHVTHETVKNWINHGKLTAYLTPGRQHRILREEFRAFLQFYGMPPLEEEPPPKRRILVVDDHQDLVQTIVSWFRMTDEYEVASAADGYEAGLLMGTFRPELVILDVFMPYRDGVEVCRKIKANPETSRVMVLVITGHPDGGTIEQAVACGADAWLLKPCGMETLQQKVEKVFERRGRSAYNRAM